MSSQLTTSESPIKSGDPPLPCRGWYPSVDCRQRLQGPIQRHHIQIRFRRDDELVRVETTDPTRALNELTSEALADGRTLEKLEVHRPTLEDVYLELVGEDVGGGE